MGEVAIADIVVHYVPHCGKDFSGNSHLHFHLVLSANDDLMVTELVEVAYLRS